MDRAGRRALTRAFAETEGEGRAVAPPFLLYLLFDADACTKEAFCRACGDLLRGEGLTGYQAVQAAWEAIPIDCRDHLKADILP